MRLDVNLLDHVLIALYFATVLGIGFPARRRISSSLDFFLAGRGLPAWITRLAFVSANLGEDPDATTGGHPRGVRPTAPKSSPTPHWGPQSARRAWAGDGARPVKEVGALARPRPGSRRRRARLWARVSAPPAAG
ncbi:hypothetical protein ACBI99_06065 [Nonomuraea sp. ATR24]|uniref:hypothetical protein n=1 Tax=Nonomuraea sp. ATR24 TaxID=1676744 RepID=UPI0035C130E9